MIHILTAVRARRGRGCQEWNRRDGFWDGVTTQERGKHGPGHIKNRVPIQRDPDVICIREGRHQNPDDTRLSRYNQVTSPGIGLTSQRLAHHRAKVWSAYCSCVLLMSRMYRMGKNSQKRGYTDGPTTCLCQILPTSSKRKRSRQSYNKHYMFIKCWFNVGPASTTH